MVSGVLVALAAVLAVVGLLADSAFVYISLIAVFLAAALLPVGAARRLRG